MNDHLIGFFRERAELFPFERRVDLERFLVDNQQDPDILPVPSKLFSAYDSEMQGYGFPVTRSEPVEELEGKLLKWLEEEVKARRDQGPKGRVEDAFRAYRTHALKLAQNALQSSILSDYHTIFWLLHSQQASRLFGNLPRLAEAMAADGARDQNDTLKYVVFAKWTQAVRELIPEITSQRGLAPGFDDRRLRFVRLIADNPLIASEEFINNDFKELRTYFAGSARRDFAAFNQWIVDNRSLLQQLFDTNPVFRRAITLLGYPDVGSPLVILDRRVQQLLVDQLGQPWPDQQFLETFCTRLIEYFVVHQLRRGILWMPASTAGDALGDQDSAMRALRPMDFGRRGVVEAVVYRFGLVYDITEFTQTLGDAARGGKTEEQTSYLQMLGFQSQLAEVAKRHHLQFEKFLGDGAFYTSRRAIRTCEAALDIQQYYSAMRSKGFVFNKGMRIAINYGYYRLLPMKVSAEGGDIKEFYGPGVVELSRLTTGKATKTIEDVQHLLITMGYDESEVYRFFQPVLRDVDTSEDVLRQREFYAYVNAHGNLINEGIVASLPFIKELSSEIAADREVLYRMRTVWATYIGFSMGTSGMYAGARLLGSVNLKGIGNMEVAELVRLSTDQAEISPVEDEQTLMPLLQQERNRSTAQRISGGEFVSAPSELVVCESYLNDGLVILIGEWDAAAGEVRRPIRLGVDEAERYGLFLPLSAETVLTQTAAYQKLYEELSQFETLPAFSISTIHENGSFSAFIIGETVQRI